MEDKKNWGGIGMRMTEKSVFLHVKKYAMAKIDILYNKIEYNVKAALLRMKDLKEENDRLRAEKERKERENEALRAQVTDLEEKMKLLVVTKTTFDKEDNKKTKKQINDWVREIDNCIALLKNR